jgi:ankyrin repeat protein
VADIFEAIASGDVDRVRELAPEQGRARNPEGVSALMLARYYGNDAAADAIRRQAGELDVFEAASFGGAERLRSLLDERPELARAWSSDGYTALHYACFFGQPDATRALIERGADIDAIARGDNRVAPLQSAAAGGNLEAARLLLEAGADVNCREEGSFTPLHSAAQNGDAAMARLLIEHGADRDGRLEDGRTPRDLAQNPELRALL